MCVHVYKICEMKFGGCRLPFSWLDQKVNDPQFIDIVIGSSFVMAATVIATASETDSRHTIVRHYVMFIKVCYITRTCVIKVALFVSGDESDTDNEDSLN